MRDEHVSRRFEKGAKRGNLMFYWQLEIAQDHFECRLYLNGKMKTMLKFTQWCTSTLSEMAVHQSNTTVQL